jgi:hypothetical protein
LFNNTDIKNEFAQLIIKYLNKMKKTILLLASLVMIMAAISCSEEDNTLTKALANTTWLDEVTDAAGMPVGHKLEFNETGLSVSWSSYFLADPEGIQAGANYTVTVSGSNIELHVWGSNQTAYSGTFDKSTMTVTNSETQQTYRFTKQ